MQLYNQQIQWIQQILHIWVSAKHLTLSFSKSCSKISSEAIQTTFLWTVTLVYAVTNAIKCNNYYLLQYFDSPKHYSSWLSQTSVSFHYLRLWSTLWATQVHKEVPESDVMDCFYPLSVSAVTWIMMYNDAHRWFYIKKLWITKLDFF